MRFDDDPKIPEGDYIPGIYNYCNRWCERCMYTDRCMTFEMEKEIKMEIEKEKKREKSMEENKDFWDQVNKTIEEAAELIDEEIPLVKDDFSSFDDWDDEDAHEAMREYKEKHKKARNQPLSKVARKYEKTVHQWFKDRKETLKQHYDPETKDFNISYTGIADEAVLKQLTESVEVILWYEFQIEIKTQRAFSSLFEEKEDPGLWKDFPKDSDGSARVASMGIDSSIGAWNYLNNKLTSEKETIKPIIRMLLWMKMEIEKEFPGAKDFVWPPKLD
ncbi:MAG: hypothetical protein GXO89_09160 [Chlorobi bacterium]|nr:hypothetical protein [Chlorobiota bacterium]